MTKRSRIAAMAAAAFFLAALLFTVLALTVDVQPIGPTVPDEPHRGYSVGFAAMNGGFRDAIKTSAFCYTSFFILALLALVMGLAPIGLFGWQMIQKKDLKKVNYSNFIQAVFYAGVAVFMLLFVLIPIERRPVVEMSGKVLSSFPSPVLMAVLTVFVTFPTFLRTLLGRWSGQRYAKLGCYALAVLAFFMSMFSGVHWLSDAFAAVLFAGLLVSLFYFVFFQLRAKRRAERKRAQREAY